MTNDAIPQKLVVMIVSANDGERLMQALVAEGIPATRIGSAGGFLRRGNTTIFSGVAEDDVEHVLQLVRRTCPVRTEMTPLQTLPVVGAAAGGTRPIEVRAGGAIVFVLDVERFERI